MKIKYVQLESEAFLTDLDFVAMTLEQRGAYLTLILYLYCNNGKCDLDIPALGQLCNKSTKTFEKIWQNISKKFQTRNGVIKHKRVTKELSRARKFRQAKSKAGLKGADKRWHSQSTAITKGRKRNVIEKENKDSSYSNANTTEQSHTVSSSVRPGPYKRSHIRAYNFNVELLEIIKPRNQSDRTCFRNITSWLRDGCETGRFNEQIFSRALDYAKEAAAGRNPAAVFVSLLKKELDYRPRAVKEGRL
ncbi:MAG: YdaU family protein [Planctomycetes bacterium]|nr:YdaU family protein [Planctomycetota bacterium]